MSNFLFLYKNKIIFKLIKKFKYSSVMQVPKITKITLNMGLGKSILNKKYLQNSQLNLTSLSGQKSVITYCKKSISGFKIRKGNSIGCKVTLRKKNMWIFFEKLIVIIIPRIRDFRGFSRKSFDGKGNYNIGIKDQIIFPEINYNLNNEIYGLDIAITTTAKTDKEGNALLDEFNFPFRN